MLPPPAAATKPHNLGAPFVESAALLVVWSVCVMIEGAVRFNGTEPFNDLDVTPSGEPNRIAMFLGGLFEVIFGLLGLFVGIAALVFRWFNANAVKAAMVVQAILGIYVFIAFVVVAPAYRADNAPPTGVPIALDGPPDEAATNAYATLSRGLYRWLVTLGIFTSAHFCLALQGGQFIFMARLITSATGEDFLKQKTGSKFRAIFWNANMALAGFWTFVFGCTYARNTTDDTFFVFPPHVGINIGFVIFVGLLMFFWAAFGVMLALMPNTNRAFYYPGCAFVFLFTYLNFTIVQAGLWVGGTEAIAMHTGLVIFVSFLGPYFLYQSSKKEE